MIKILFLIFILLNSVCLVGLNRVLAQELPGSSSAVSAATVTDASDEEEKFALGQVVSFSDGKITVKEHDVDNGSDTESVYIVNTETEFGNVDSLEQLRAGDNVLIDYIEKDGQRIVTMLVKQEPEDTYNEDDANPPEAGAQADDQGVRAEAVSGRKAVTINTATH